MTIYNVYIGNPRGEPYPWQELATNVAALIRPAIAQVARYSDVRVQTTMSRPTLRSDEMLCYAVSSQFGSLAGRRFGSHPSPGHAGQTYHDTGAGALCEVYRRGLAVDRLALTIVHEFFHAKTRMGNDTLHPRGGICASPPAAPTEENVRMMVQHFFQPMDFWLNGFS